MCGIAGVWFPSIVGKVDGLQPAEILSFMLASLQHRGHDATGIGTIRHGYRFEGFHKTKGFGYVFDVLTKQALENVRTHHCGIGQNRYKTSKGKTLDSVQPFSYVLGSETDEERIAVVHNGNLTNELQGGRPSDCDSWAFLESFAHVNGQRKLHLRIHQSLKYLKGGYALVYLHKDRKGKVSMICVRDPQGIRPLSIAKCRFMYGGEMRTGYLVASETIAFQHLVGVYDIRSVRPGEIITMDDEGFHSFESRAKEWGGQKKKPCVFELPYFSHVVSYIEAKKPTEALEVREALGACTVREFQKKHPKKKIDAVIAVPDSSVPQGYEAAKAAGVPYELALFRNHAVGRTFIGEKPTIADKVLRKFSFSQKRIKELRSLAIIDDSLVRGNTLTEIIKRIRLLNPDIKIYVLIAYPPVKCPCFYGIAISKFNELGYHRHKNTKHLEEIIQADILHYISWKGFFETVKKCTGYGEDGWCHACISGEQPLEIERESFKKELAKLHE